MKKVYYLSTCDTCARIMSQVPNLEEWEKVDIKVVNIITDDVDQIAEISGGYEAVFSKRARKFRSEGWNQKELTEQDFRKLILEEYTFLKRPVFLIDDQAFVGNNKKTVAALLDYLA